MAKLRCPDTVNVLLLGTGGREHAIAWKLRQSPRLGTLWVQPDANAGLLALGRPCAAPLTVRERFFLKSWIEKNEIDLVIVGPEGPLSEGIVDDLAGTRLEATLVGDLTAVRSPATRQNGAELYSLALRTVDQPLPVD